MNKNDGYFFAGAAKDDREHVYTTHDGGNSWQVNVDAIPGGTYVRQFIDNQHMIGSRTTNNSLVLFTLTNGKWVVTDYALKDKVHLLDDVSFVSPKVGAILDANGSALDVLQTTDAGKSWHKLSSLPLYVPPR